MNAIGTVIEDTGCEPDRIADRLAAELTEAAYPIVLRHGVRGSTIDLELDLWHALADTVKKRIGRFASRDQKQSMTG